MRSKTEHLGSLGEAEIMRRNSAFVGGIAKDEGAVSERNEARDAL